MLVFVPQVDTLCLDHLLLPAQVWASAVSVLENSIAIATQESYASLVLSQTASQTEPAAGLASRQDECGRATAR